MKKLMIISSILLYAFIFSSNLMAARPSLQTFKVSNRTSMPLIIKIQSAYTDPSTNKTFYEQKSIPLAAKTQGSFIYKFFKVIVGNSISYSGGPISIEVLDQNNSPIAMYQAQTTNNGQQYFAQAQTPYGFSYNLLSINENPDRSIYLSYDSLNLSIGAV